MSDAATQGGHRALKPPSPSRQVRFHQLLVAARKQWFIDALSEALGAVDQVAIKNEVIDYVPADAQKILASSGIRDEHIFPLPTVIEAKPSLVGYYRLLLGAPQKTFYSSSTGLGRFKSMEESSTASAASRPLIPDFCRAMAAPLAELVRQIPNLSNRDISELPLLTYGSQLQGSHNTAIGKQAMQGVLVAISEIVAKHLIKKEPKRLTVRNAAGRAVAISLSHDPDVAIDEQIGNVTHKKVAIEVKGGTDLSNAHNRAGEAEKSHLKAKRRGYPEFWTIISKAGLDVERLRAESQTSNHWFDVAEVLARKGQDWDDFRRRVAGVVGIPLKGKR